MRHRIDKLGHVLAWTLLVLSIWSLYQLNLHTTLGADATFFSQSQNAPHSTSIIPAPQRAWLTPLKQLKTQPHAKQTYMINLNYNGALFQTLWAQLMSLPKATLAWVWFHINLISLMIGYTLIYRCFSNRWGPSYPLILTGILFTPSTFNSMHIGQVEGLVALLVGLLVYLQQQQKTHGFAITLGIAIAFKYFFALLLIHFVRARQWSILGLTLLITICACLLPTLTTNLPSYPLHLWSNFAITLLIKAQLLLNTSLLGWLARLGNTWPPILIYLGYISSCFFLIFYFLKPTQPLLDTPKSLPSLPHLSLYLAMAFCLSPLSWSYYSPCLWPAWAYIALTTQNQKTALQKFMLFFLLLWLYLLPADFRHTIHQNIPINTPQLMWYAYGPPLLQWVFILMLVDAPRLPKSYENAHYPVAGLTLIPLLSWLPFYIFG